MPMNGLLTKQLEQISKLISGLDGDDADLDKLTELSQSLEFLSHQIKTSYFDGFPDDRRNPDHGIRQDAVFYFNHKFQIFRIAGAIDNIFRKMTETSLPEVREIFSAAEYEEFKKEAIKVFKTGEPRKFYSEIISKNNLKLPIYFLLERITLGENLQAVSAGMVFSSQTPSELENYREILLENIPGIGVYLFDTSFRYVLTGGRDIGQLGLSNTDFTGKTLFEVFDERTMKRLFPFYRNALEGNESEGEVRIKDRVHFIHSTPIFGLARQVVGGALISQDVTAEKEIEKNLLRAKREAEESNNAKSIFMANMSHEIRTPLNAIIGFSDLLSKTRLSPEQEKFCQLVIQSSEHLLSVVNEILFLFKYGMGKVYIEKVPLDIHELVTNVWESLRLKAEEKELIFNSEIDKNIPAVLIGDPFRVKQILMNLTGNALKFTEKGKVNLLVKAERFSQKKVYIRFEVADTGTGIHKEDQDKIFDEFTQSRYRNPEKKKGVGLGLTIVKKLVELLNGRINVVSTPGTGSKFIVVIPFIKPLPANKEIPDFKYELNKNLLKGKKILYADDDTNNILLGESILRKWETEFDIAHDGGEAVEYLSKKKYDIVLLDIRMPVMMGTEVVRQVRNAPDNINVKTKMLAVTANIMESDILTYMKAGFNGYILKPFGEEYLYNKICNLLKMKEFNKKPLNKNSETGSDSDNESFDTSMLLKTTGGNSDFFNKMIETFIANAKETVINFRELSEANKWAEIGEQAHKAIPSFSYFGLKHLVNDLIRIENMALREKNYSSIGELAKTTSYKIERIIEIADKSKI